MLAPLRDDLRRPRVIVTMLGAFVVTLLILALVTHGIELSAVAVAVSVAGLARIVAGGEPDDS